MSIKSILVETGLNINDIVPKNPAWGQVDNTITPYTPLSHPKGVIVLNHDIQESPFSD